MPGIRTLDVALGMVAAAHGSINLATSWHRILGQGESINLFGGSLLKF